MYYIFHSEVFLLYVMNFHIVDFKYKITKSSMAKNEVVKFHNLSTRIYARVLSMPYWGRECFPEMKLFALKERNLTVQ